MIFGLDVSHGSPGDASSPSVAAAVASMQWPLIELLRDFFNTCQAPGMNDRKPQQIVIYRDGGSESQFEQVIEKELITLKNACTIVDTEAVFDSVLCDQLVITYYTMR
ncbi:hypothetical protein R1flu_024086 [Riccia fluitans]|uniref:Piwi domain-containing protein n=1 Tax=Riccia fluitans TaxID=41844 RepID=A0ABD1XTW0_9MARC